MTGILAALMLVMSVTATSSPTTCDRCGISRPIAPSLQWDADHAAAHRVADVILRMQARIVQLDAGRWRAIERALREQIHAMRREKWGECGALLDEALHTIEALILRVERLEGEIRRRPTP